MSYKSRVKNLIAELEKDLFEREECVRLVLLAMFAGKAIFLYGPPGTAKSMIARKISLAFGEPKDFFSALMHRFSTPEDIFGPIDIGQLKQNRLVRNTKGYLPTASFAFLDEIWKSSPAILNTLLTIINERLFKEGDTDIKVPLKGIVCASNEFPPTNQGLEALYDRMLLRYFVEPLKSKKNFLKLITSQEGKSSSQHAFSLEELESIHQQAAQIPFSQEALESLHTIKATLEQLKHNPTLVAKFLGESAPTKEEQETTEPDSNLIATPSDRRFKQCAQLLQVAALLSDQSQVSTPDLALLRHCLWDSLEQIPLVNAILEQCLKSSHPRVRNFEQAQDELKHLEYTATAKNATLDMFHRIYQTLHAGVQTHIQEIEEELQEAIQNANVFFSQADQKIPFGGTQELIEEFKVLLLNVEEVYSKNLVGCAERDLEKLKEVFIEKSLDEGERMYKTLLSSFQWTIELLEKDSKFTILLRELQKLHESLCQMFKDAQNGVFAKIKQERERKEHQQRQEQVLATLEKDIDNIIRRHGGISNNEVIATPEFKEAVKNIIKVLKTYIKGTQQQNELVQQLNPIQYPYSYYYNGINGYYQLKQQRNLMNNILQLAEKMRQVYQEVE
ncbi:AAA family ATPase [Helicobacter felis]|uniref:AAA family ATPase n=1 Tax=Helicobacter felis TaxID=214 RepID=UPI001F2BA758|nr:AAA family ATPase [Helicobacter felis]